MNSTNKRAKNGSKSLLEFHLNRKSAGFHGMKLILNFSQTLDGVRHYSYICSQYCWMAHSRLWYNHNNITYKIETLRYCDGKFLATLLSWMGVFGVMEGNDAGALFHTQQREDELVSPWISRLLLCFSVGTYVANITCVRMNVRCVYFVYCYCPYSRRQRSLLHNNNERCSVLRIDHCELKTAKGNSIL